MREAAWQDGFEAEERSMESQNSKIRVDLSLKELMKIRRLVHFSFENMMPNKGGPFAFKVEKEAQEATNSILQLEFCIPKELHDSSDPYALSFNRQTMIWKRWPSEERAPRGSCRA